MTYRRTVHPLEHLRHVARSEGVDPRVLVEETAAALRGMALDPAGLLLAARRMLERQPECGPLWVLCSRMLTADDPRAAARLTVREVLDDPTEDRFGSMLDEMERVCVVGRPPMVSDVLATRPHLEVVVVDDDTTSSALVRRLGRLDVVADLVPASHLSDAVRGADAVVVEALAVADERVLVPTGSLALVAVARALGVPATVVVGAARRLPTRTFDHIVGVLDAAGNSRPMVELVRLTAADRILSPSGLGPLDRSGGGDCDVVPELLVAIPN